MLNVKTTQASCLAFALILASGPRGHEARIGPGSVLFVDRNAIGVNDGSSWQDAFTHLQDALNAAAGNAEIWIAEGMYFPDEGALQTPGDQGSAFVLSGSIDLIGGFLPGDTSIAMRGGSAANTILSGDLGGDDSLFSTSDNSTNVVRAVNLSGRHGCSALSCIYNI